MSPAKPMRLAVVGTGKVGLACAELIGLSHDLAVAAFVRRPLIGQQGLPESHRHIPVVNHVGQMREVQAAFLCVPTHAAADAASQIIHHGISIVDCATLHGEAFRAHERHPETRRSSQDSSHCWSRLGSRAYYLCLLLARTAYPQRNDRDDASAGGKPTSHGPGVAGVKNVLCAEVQTPDGRRQRYVYVKLENNADADRVSESIRTDPLFLGEDTQVFVVESVASHEQQGRGIVLDRHGATGRLEHQHFGFRADSTKQS